MSLLGSSTMANTMKEKILSAAQFGRVLVEAVRTGVRASAVVTRQSIENAVAPVMAIGGSTNAVLHHLGIADAVGVEWTIYDFERVRRKTSVLCDLKPSGRYMAIDLHRAGGTLAVLHELLGTGLMDGDCLTVMGRKVGEEIEGHPGAASDQDVIQTVASPDYAQGHLAILKGNLPENGTVAKITVSNHRASKGRRACLTTSRVQWMRSWRDVSTREMSLSCAISVPRVPPACPRC